MIIMIIVPLFCERYWLLVGGHESLFAFLKDSFFFFFLHKKHVITWN